MVQFCRGIIDFHAAIFISNVQTLTHIAALIATYSQNRVKKLLISWLLHTW